MSSDLDMAQITMLAAIGGGVNILVYCIGIVAAIIGWRRAPRAAAICISAMLLLLLVQTIAPISIMVLSRMITIRDLAQFQILINMVGGILHAVGIAALVVAVLIDRRGALRE